MSICLNYFLNLAGGLQNMWSDIYIFSSKGQMARAHLMRACPGIFYPYQVLPNLLEFWFNLLGFSIEAKGVGTHLRKQPDLPYTKGSIPFEREQHNRFVQFEAELLRIGRKEEQTDRQRDTRRVRLSPKPGRTVGIGSSRECDPGFNNQERALCTHWLPLAKNLPFFSSKCNFPGSQYKP
jgi:hypothetical protein